MPGLHRRGRSLLLPSLVGRPIVCNGLFSSHRRRSDGCLEIERRGSAARSRVRSLFAEGRIRATASGDRYRVARGRDHPTEMKLEYQYIQFLKAPTPKRSTSVYWCYNKKSASVLGAVQWQGPWRQYCFMPTTKIVLSKGCMEDVCDFISQLMEARKG